MIKAEKTVRVSLRNVDRLGQVDWKTNEWPPGREVQVCTAQVIPLPNLSGTPDTGTSELKMPLNFSKFICKISVDILILEAQDPRFYLFYSHFRLGFFTYI